MTLTRNQRYENAQRQQGLVKLTVWIPLYAVPDFKQAAAACCFNQNLTVSQLRDTVTGRFLSVHKAPVTGDVLSTESGDNSSGGRL